MPKVLGRLNPAGSEPVHVEQQAAIDSLAVLSRGFISLDSNYDGTPRSPCGNHLGLVESPIPRNTQSGDGDEEWQGAQVEAWEEFVEGPVSHSFKLSANTCTPTQILPMSPQQHTATLTLRSQSLARQHDSTSEDASDDDSPVVKSTDKTSIRQRVEDLCIQLQHKDDQIALLTHLANTNANSPITEDLSQLLSAAVADSVRSEGQEFKEWLMNMQEHRERLFENMQVQQDNAVLLMEARESLAQLIVHKVQEVQEGSLDLDLIGDAFEESIEAVEQLMSTVLVSRMRELDVRAAIGEIHRAQLKSELFEAKSNCQVERQKCNEHEAAKATVTDALAGAQRQMEEMGLKMKEMEQEHSRLHTQLKQSKRSEGEKERKFEQYRLDIAKKMASVKERLELLQVERGKLIEDNRLLTESQRKLGEKLAACEVRLQKARTQHEDTLAEVANEHFDEIRQLQQDHRKDIAALERRLQDTTNENIKLFRQLQDVVLKHGGEGNKPGKKSLVFEIPGVEREEEDEEGEVFSHKKLLPASERRAADSEGHSVVAKNLQSMSAHAAKTATYVSNKLGGRVTSQSAAARASPDLELDDTHRAYTRNEEALRGSGSSNDSRSCVNFDRPLEVTSLSGIRKEEQDKKEDELAVLHKKHQEDVEALEQEVVAAGELVHQYRSEVLSWQNKCVAMERTLAELQQITPRGSSESVDTSLPSPRSSRKHHAGEAKRENNKASLRQQLRTRASLGSGSSDVNRELVQQVKDLHSELEAAQRACSQVKDKNAALSREKTKLTECLRDAKEDVRRLEDEVTATQRKLLAAESIVLQSPRSGFPQIGNKNTLHDQCAVTPPALGSVDVDSSGGAIVENRNGMLRFPLNKVKNLSCGEDHQHSALKTPIMTPRGMGPEVPEEVRELVRNNRRMQKSIADITAAKDKALAHVAALREECDELAMKASQAKSYLRQRDFQRERVNALSEQLKEVTLKLEIAEETLEAQREGFKHQARLQDRAVLAESQEKMFSQQLKASQQHTSVLLQQVEDAQNRIRTQMDRCYKLELEIEKLVHVNGKLRDGVHDIKILMDGLQELMPELEAEAQFICQDRARLAQWAMSQKTESRSSNASFLQKETELLEALRKETAVLKKEKETLESEMKLHPEGNRDPSSARPAGVEEQEEEEKARLNDAVTQLQLTVEILDRRLESEAAAQNAQILSIVAKLEQEESAHNITRDKLREMSQEVDDLNRQSITQQSALQSCMDAIAAGKTEKALLQATISELEEKNSCLLDLKVNQNTSQVTTREETDKDGDPRHQPDSDQEPMNQSDNELIAAVDTGEHEDQHPNTEGRESEVGVV